MPESTHATPLHLGFLRIVASDGAYVGGLLVTNRQGRPLEFQCTTPVRPNRTQQILYGPTLESFICADLIGKTLVDRLAVKPHIVIVSLPALLELRGHIDAPVACIVDPAQHGLDLPDGTHLQLGRQRVRFHPDFPQDHVQFSGQLSLVPSDADLVEPLERVAEALQETMRPGAVA